MTSSNKRGCLACADQILPTHPSPLLREIGSELVERALGLLLLDLREARGEPLGEGGAVAVDVEAGKVAVNWRGRVEGWGEEVSVPVRKRDK
jgi:hypothetical protein